MSRRYSDNFMFQTSKMLEACCVGNLEALRQLVEQGGDVNEPSFIGRSPLHGAVVSNHKDVILYLLRNGANVNATDAGKSTPLHYAAQYGYHDIVKLLTLSGADINKKNSNGATALHVACQNGHAGCVKALLDTGVADLEDTTHLGETPMKLAGHNSTIAQLLQSAEKNPPKVAKKGSLLDNVRKQQMFQRYHNKQAAETLLQHPDQQTCFQHLSPRP